MHKIPIWLCHKPDERVSSSMRGCADVTIEYESLDDLMKKSFKSSNMEFYAPEQIYAHESE